MYNNQVLYCFWVAKSGAIGRAWDETVFSLLFAVQDTVSCAAKLGFSLAALVFRHLMHGPLKVLKEKLLSMKMSPKVKVLDLISTFQDRRHHAYTLAQQALHSSQSKLKEWFN